MSSEEECRNIPCCSHLCPEKSRASLVPVIVHSCDIGSSANKSLCCEQSVIKTRFKQSSESWISQCSQCCSSGVTVSPKVMSEISQRINSAIRSVITITTVRHQRNIRMSQKEKPAHDFNMVAEQVMFKGLSRAGINAVRHNVKDFLPQELKRDRGEFKAWADEVMLFLSIEEPRLTGILKQLQTTRQPITDANVISGYSLDGESKRFTSLSKVILHRLLSMTEGESHVLVQSLIHTACGYEAWRQLNTQYHG
eukprot:6202897-Amphidinium_carterae.1